VFYLSFKKRANFSKYYAKDHRTPTVFETFLKIAKKLQASLETGGAVFHSETNVIEFSYSTYKHTSSLGTVIRHDQQA
jgi:hypothetical protein